MSLRLTDHPKRRTANGQAVRGGPRGAVNRRGVLVREVLALKGTRASGAACTRSKSKRRRKRAGARAHGKWTRRIGTRARKSTMTMVDRAGHPAVADDELHLAMNPTGHETRRDQRVGDKGYERERCEALPNRSTKKPCLMTAHTRALCAKQGREKQADLFAEARNIAVWAHRAQSRLRREVKTA